jgi:hypothetical protein
VALLELMFAMVIITIMVFNIINITKTFEIIKIYFTVCRL